MSSTKRVIVGVNGSLSSINVVQFAAATAISLEVPLTAVIAWQPPGGEITARRMPCRELDTACRDYARQTLVTTLDNISMSMEVRLLVIRGPVAASLINIADDPADLLVVGASRHRFTIGNVNRYCLARSRCPVLIVPKPALLNNLSASHRRSIERETRTKYRPPTNY